MLMSLEQCKTTQNLLVNSIPEFLSTVQDENYDFKAKLIGKMDLLCNGIFRGKTIEECINQIQEKYTLRNDDLNLVNSRNYQFSLNFIACCLETYKNKNLEEFNEEELNELRKLSPGLTDYDIDRLITNKQKNPKEIWDVTADEVLLNIIKKKYPLIFDPSDQECSKIRIKWKDVCKQFKEEIPQKNRYRNILGKNLRERWINHLNPNMKKGSWNSEEDKMLLISAWKFKRRWCLVANELKTRSQHNIKNRFFHLIAENLKITNKSCLKRKKLNDDIAKILAKKYDYFLPIEKKTKFIRKSKNQNNQNLNKSFVDKNQQKIESQNNILDNLENKNENLINSIQEKPFQNQIDQLNSFNFGNQNLNLSYLNPFLYGGISPLFFNQPSIFNQMNLFRSTQSLMQRQYMLNYNYLMNILKK